eukprot:6472233-Amphidinium_carterae.2
MRNEGTQFETSRMGCVDDQNHLPEAAVDANVKTLCNIDKDAIVDVTVIAQLGGEGGLKALQTEFTQKCGPVAGNKRTLSMAVAASKILLKSDMVAMMPEGVQLQVRSMQETLESLSKRVTPKRPTAFTAWQQGFWLSLPSFYLSSASTGANGSKSKVGIEAFEKDIATLESSDRKDVKVLESLECWTPFMTDEMGQRVDALRKSSNVGAKKRPLKSASATESKPSGAKTAPTATESAEQAVMAMLRRRTS